MKKNGFFIECGAADGVTYSNSYLLEKKFGWKGLLIEPIGEQFNLLKKYRKKMICENFMLASSEYSGKKIQMYKAGPLSLACEDEIDGATLSTQSRKEKLKNLYLLEGREEVQAITLSEILDRHNITEVDVLFLDVEGTELSVLEGWDHKRHHINHLIVETSSIESLKKYLSTKGFKNCKNMARGDYLFF